MVGHHFPLYTPPFHLCSVPTTDRWEVDASSEQVRRLACVRLDSHRNLLLACHRYTAALSLSMYQGEKFFFSIRVLQRHWGFIKKTCKQSEKFVNYGTSVRKAFKQYNIFHANWILWSKYSKFQKVKGVSGSPRIRESRHISAWSLDARWSTRAR